MTVVVDPLRNGILDPENPGAIGGTTPAAGTFTTVTMTVNASMTGVAARYLADFSNATFSSRMYFQTSTAGGSTSMGAIPNGAGTVSLFNMCNTSDPDNCSIGRIICTSTEVRYESTAVGSGTLLPATVYSGGGLSATFSTAHNFTCVGTIGGTSATALISSAATMNNGAGAGAGTLLNAPSAGNPTKWIPINDNGTTRYIPTW